MKHVTKALKFSLLILALSGASFAILGFTAFAATSVAESGKLAQAATFSGLLAGYGFLGGLLISLSDKESSDHVDNNPNVYR